MMSDEEEDNVALYKIVVNQEEQYSVWPESRENPIGWKDEGHRGSREECLAYIKKVWQDQRPFSLRNKMETGGYER